MIELDGPQHFRFYPAFHVNGHRDFEEQARRDRLKNAYARDHKWSILRISWTEYGRLGDIVDDFIKDFVGGGRKRLERFTDAELCNQILCGERDTRYTWLHKWRRNTLHPRPYAGCKSPFIGKK